MSEPSHEDSDLRKPRDPFFIPGSERNEVGHEESPGHFHGAEVRGSHGDRYVFVYYKEHHVLEARALPTLLRGSYEINQGRYGRKNADHGRGRRPLAVLDRWPNEEPTK